jgi:hypothetical protein
MCPGAAVSRRLVIPEGVGLLDPAGAAVEPVALFLRELQATGRSAACPGTVSTSSMIVTHSGADPLSMRVAVAGGIKSHGHVQEQRVLVAVSVSYALFRVIEG